MKLHDVFNSFHDSEFVALVLISENCLKEKFTEPEVFIPSHLLFIIMRNENAQKVRSQAGCHVTSNNHTGNTPNQVLEGGEDGILFLTPSQP